MKRVLAILLAAVLALSLAACGANKGKVDEELQGIWSSTSGTTTYVFDNGVFSAGAYEGSYKINGSSITLTYDNGFEAKFKYTFKNGELTVFWGDSSISKKEN
jgi:uncharacterized lipoprotein YehR (DUF1307 family)